MRGIVTADFRPFAIVDELTNFFAMVTAYERTQGLEVLENFTFGTYNPTRHLYVYDAADNRRGQPPSDGSAAGYNAQCWTNLRRYPEICVDFTRALRENNALALRDAGALRLIAALSFMHQQYMWSRDIDVIDPIAEVDDLGAIDSEGPVSDEAQMREPIDPRQLRPVAGTNRLELTPQDAPMFRVPTPLKRSDVVVTGVTGQGLYGAPALNTDFVLSRLDVQELLKQLVTRNAWLADAAKRAVETSPTTATIELTAAQFRSLQVGVEKQMGKTSATYSLKDPLRNVLFSVPDEPRANLAPVLLVGGVALLALKFLR